MTVPNARFEFEKSDQGPQVDTTNRTFSTGEGGLSVAIHDGLP